MRNRLEILVAFLIVLNLVSIFGCAPRILKPFPPVDKTNPDVWGPEKCNGVSKVWWGKQGTDPSKTSDLWHCGDWKIYDKSVAP